MAITVTLQPDITTGKAAWIYSVEPDTNKGTGTTMHIVATDIHLLMDFSLRNQNLPQKLSVISAYLTFTHGNATAGSYGFNLGHCLRNWVETQATWNVYSTGNNWQTAGALGALDNELILDNVAITFKDATDIAINIFLPPKAITRQLTDPSVYGWVFTYNSTNFINPTVVHSPESTTANYRPKLTIVYEPLTKMFQIDGFSTEYYTLHSRT